MTTISVNERGPESTHSTGFARHPVYGAAVSIALIIILDFALAGCAMFPSYGDAEELLFNTGFAGTTVERRSDVSDRLTGVDPDFASLSAWEGLSAHPAIGSFWINYEAGTTAQRYAMIADDPDPAVDGNPVLMFKIISPHIVEGDHQKGRVNAYLEDLTDMGNLSQSVRLFLHPDMAALKDWSATVNWLTLFEFWSTDYFRISVSLYKPAGPADRLRFRVSCTTRWALGAWTQQWLETAEYAVPFGRWMTIELAARAGDADTGTFSMAVTDADAGRLVLFNLARLTGNPEGYTGFNPMKLYTSDALIEYMSASNKALEVYWDDWCLSRVPPAP